MSHNTWRKQRLAQRGAAILLAMLTVVLVATLASAMMWQQWRSVELESTQRVRVQASWVLTGALDWARLILREDARQGGTDHLSEPWAVPLAPARLTTFLAAERGQALVGDGNDADQDAFLAGNMQDLQGRLNVTNLVVDGKLSEPARAAWGRLFNQLKLSQSEFDALTQGLVRASTFAAQDKHGPLTPLMPRTVADLAWLGLSTSTLQTLEPFATLLPVRTAVNLNTALPEVLVAAVPGLSMAKAQEMVQLRSVKPFSSLTDAALLQVGSGLVFDSAEHAVASRFFSVVGQLRMGQFTVQERSVLQREGLAVQILSRTREVLTLTTPATPLQ
jgi:general secretion pathway protein K